MVEPPKTPILRAGEPQPRDIPRNPLVAGRWFKRAGNIFGRYTYEGTHAPPEPILDRMDPQLRRSPPVEE